MKKLDPVQLIGLAVCAVIFIVGMRHTTNERKAMMAQMEAQQIQIAQQAADAKSSADTRPSSAAVAPAVSTAAVSSAAAATPAVKREDINLSIDDISAITVDGNGAGVKRIELSRFSVQSKDPARKNARQVLTSLDLPLLGIHAPGMLLREAATPENTANGVTIHRIDEQRGIAVDETWAVSNDPGSEYGIAYTLTLTNRSSAVQNLPQLAMECGALPDFVSEESNTSFSNGISGGVAYGIPLKDSAVLLNQKAITKKMTDKRAAQYRTTQLTWLCVHSKYFMFALRDLTIGDVPSTFAGFEAGAPRDNSRGGCHAVALLPQMTLSPGESRTIKVSGYAGPKDYRTLQRMGQGIDSIVGMDYFFFWHFKWMGWICRILLECMTLIAGWFPPCIAYGMGIILVTLLVKLIFLPLSWKSTKDMRKMSAIQPELKALREKYGKDPQRMYYEQQKLFKERGVSQLGGCLPMLVQIPVFFAMFNTFRSAVEIRNASFLWAMDLSMPDAIFGLPIHPLALMTGITMFFQQKLTPTPDPNQAKMMNIMSLVFIVFFYNMPAGLTLYMTVNQLFSVIQMLLFRRWDKKNAAVIAK